MSAFPPNNPYLALDSSTSITIGGVECWDEGGTEHLNIRNPRATRVLVCAWADRLSLSAAIGGGYNSVTNAYDAPTPHPLYVWLWPSDIHIDGIPGPNGMTNDTINGQQLAGYLYARLQVTFTRFDYDPTLITTGEVSVEHGVELIRPSATQSTLQWADGTPVPAMDTMPIRIATDVINVTRYNCKSVPLGFNQAKSCSNVAPFYGYPAETVVFDGFTDDKTITVGGANVWTIRLRFVFKACGWNTIWRPDQSSFQPVTTLTPSNTVTVPITDLTPTGGLFTGPSSSVSSVTTGTAGGKKPYPTTDFGIFSSYF